MKKLIIILLLTIPASTTFAQPAIQWQKCYGGSYSDFSTSIQPTFDGGYVIAGYACSNDGEVSGTHGGYDYWVVKTNATGAIEWQKSYGGSITEFAYSVQQTSDSGYIVAGLGG